jgi:hypothetical protein
MLTLESLGGNTRTVKKGVRMRGEPIQLSVKHSDVIECRLMPDGQRRHYLVANK